MAIQHFISFVGALALGPGLAFGLGCRDTAARLVEGWYTTAQAAQPKLAHNKMAEVVSNFFILGIWLL